MVNHLFQRERELAADAGPDRNGRRRGPAGGFGKGRRTAEGRNENLRILDGQQVAHRPGVHLQAGRARQAGPREDQVGFAVVTLKPERSVEGDPTIGIAVHAHVRDDGREGGSTGRREAVQREPELEFLPRPQARHKIALHLPTRQDGEASSDRLGQQCRQLARPLARRLDRLMVPRQLADAALDGQEPGALAPCAQRGQFHLPALRRIVGGGGQREVERLQQRLAAQPGQGEVAHDERRLGTEREAAVARTGDKLAPQVGAGRDVAFPRDQRPQPRQR